MKNEFERQITVSKRKINICFNKRGRKYDVYFFIGQKMYGGILDSEEEAIKKIREYIKKNNLWNTTQPETK
ncbi:MAG: hypothetical protein PHQ35_10685 [Phycisphaerae bacterium]|nr:hypothetical protein [Phycisphaerae bacterium]